MSDESASEDPPRGGSRGRHLGRRAGQVVYYALVGAFAFSATWQVTQQIFFPHRPDVEVTVESCEEGLGALLAGIEDAKHAADRDSGDQNEEAALHRFRQALAPSWSQRDAIGDMCTSQDHKRLLDAIDRLRYSEEHGVRKQAAELTALRRRVDNMAREVLPQEQDVQHER